MIPDTLSFAARALTITSIGTVMFSRAMRICPALGGANAAIDLL